MKITLDLKAEAAEKALKFELYQKIMFRDGLRLSYDKNIQLENMTFQQKGWVIQISGDSLDGRLIFAVLLRMHSEESFTVQKTMFLVNEKQVNKTIKVKTGSLLDISQAIGKVMKTL